MLDKVSGKIDLENVEFSYTKDRKLIENLNLNVEPGQRVAIVGPTGSGKTTLINLLMRFYDVNDGSIDMDGFYPKYYTKESKKKFRMVCRKPG